MPQVIFCALLCIFTNNIHESAKNSSAGGTCVCWRRLFYFTEDQKSEWSVYVLFVCGISLTSSQLITELFPDWASLCRVEGLWADCQASMPLNYLEGGQCMVT